MPTHITHHTCQYFSLTGLAGRVSLVDSHMCMGCLGQCSVCRRSGDRPGSPLRIVLCELDRHRNLREAGSIDEHWRAATAVNGKRTLRLSPGVGISHLVSKVDRSGLETRGQFHENGGSVVTVDRARGGRKRRGGCGEGGRGVEMVSEKLRRSRIGSGHSLALDLAILRQLAHWFLARGVVRRGRRRQIRLFLRACNRHWGVLRGAGGGGARGEGRQQQPDL